MQGTYDGGVTVRGTARVMLSPGKPTKVHALQSLRWSRFTSSTPCSAVGDGARIDPWAVRPVCALRAPSPSRERSRLKSGSLHLKDLMLRPKAYRSETCQCRPVEGKPNSFNQEIMLNCVMSL
jgi:hypothetical protein